MRPWEFKAKADGNLEILMYEQIGKDFWSDEGITAKDFAEELKAAGNPAQITVRLNSPGGEVFDGLAIYNTLLNHPAKVIVEVDGLAASIASVIAMAGDSVIMAKNAMLMIHNPHSLVIGDSNVMRKMAETMDKVRDSMVLAYQRHSELPKDQIEALMNSETWMVGAEAVTNGFATSVSSEDSQIAASVKGFDLSKFKNVPESFTKKKAMATVEVDSLREAAKGVRIAAQANSTANAEEIKMENQTTVTVEVDNYSEVASDILETCLKYDVEASFAQKWIKEKKSLVEAKMAISDVVMRRSKEKANTSGLATSIVDALSEKDRKDYSIVKALRWMAGEDGVDAPLEREMSKEIGKKLGKGTAGIFIPTRIKASGLDTKSGGSGGYSVETELKDVIEILRNRARVFQLGATALTGLDSNVAFPVQLSASNGSWVSQNPSSDVSDSDDSFGQKVMSPKTYQASTSYSRQLLAQSTIDIESFVRTDLAIAHALAIDLAALNGSGLANQPLGLLKTSGIGDVAMGTNGAAPDYTTVVDLETAIANANADEAGMKYLTTPTMRGKLRKTQQFATTNGLPVWQQNGGSLGVGDVLGYEGYVSKQVPGTLTKGSSSDCHAIIFGYWPAMLVGEWGVIELVVDPYRLKKQGMIEVTSFQMVDVLIRQPAQFAACQDARNV